MSRMLRNITVILVLLAISAGFPWMLRPLETQPFVDNYLERERPVVLYSGVVDYHLRDFFYGLVIEDTVGGVVLHDPDWENNLGRQGYGYKYEHLSNGNTWQQCKDADALSHKDFLTSAPRSRYDVLRGRCVIVTFSNELSADIQMIKTRRTWSFRQRQTAKQIASIRLGEDLVGVRSLFGDGVNAASDGSEGVLADDFSERQFIRSIRIGGFAEKAATSILAQRTQIKDRGLIPRVSITKKSSPALAKEILASVVPVGKDTAAYPIVLKSLISAANSKTAEFIYPQMIEMLYAPIRTTKPFGPWHYGDKWKLQIRAQRPNLERNYTQNRFVPVFASAVAINHASALVLKLDQPFIDRFYQEFKTYLIGQATQNSGPSLIAAIVAKSGDVRSIISSLRKKPVGSIRSPNYHAVIWSLIAQYENSDKGFTDELKQECANDPNVLSNPVANRKYLNGKTFCSHFFGISPSGS